MSFIQSIQINHVRHLKNIDIPLDTKKKKNLILTGKNGSGKTSLLEAIEKSLFIIQNQAIFTMVNQHQHSVQVQSDILKSNPEHPQSGLFKQRKKKSEDELGAFNKEVILNILDLKEINTQFQQGDFVLAFFKAKRNHQLDSVAGPKKLIEKTSYTFQEHANAQFLQFLVNLKTERSYARDDEDTITVNKIDAWFQKFESQLCQLFSDSTLALKFDRKNYNFYFQSQGHETFDFNTLSGGYQAILDIITELMMRMHTKGRLTYDAQGIVLIDEVETHLHLALQKQILPFLSTFFPNIQFIVSTHSPFVINSIANAVVYDLEYQEAIHDLSAYSYDALVESYFDLDKYSNILKQKVAEYSELVHCHILNTEQLSTMKQLQQDLSEQVHAPFSGELKLKFAELEIQRKLNHGSL